MCNILGHTAAPTLIVVSSEPEKTFVGLADSARTAPL